MPFQKEEQEVHLSVCPALSVLPVHLSCLSWYLSVHPATFPISPSCHLSMGPFCCPAYRYFQHFIFHECWNSLDPKPICLKRMPWHEHLVWVLYNWEAIFCASADLWKDFHQHAFRNGRSVTILMRSKLVLGFSSLNHYSSAKQHSVHQRARYSAALVPPLHGTVRDLGRLWKDQWYSQRFRTTLKGPVCK